MQRIDRNVLRIGVFELKHLTDIPRKVTINEAVELAKNFGNEASSSFINGRTKTLYACTEDELVLIVRNRHRYISVSPALHAPPDTPPGTRPTSQLLIVHIQLLKPTAMPR